MAKKIKGSIKYSFELDNEQDEAFKSIKTNQITVITGLAGTGKSLCCTMAALDMLFRKEVSKVFITRSIEEVGRPMGFLPGLAKDKLDPYIKPFIDSCKKVYNHSEKIDEFIEKGVFEVLPVQFIRGHSIERKEVLFVEEAQNLSKHEMLAVLTRISIGGKIVISGDVNQTDTKQLYTGLDYVMELSEHIDGIKHFHLTQNHRSGLVKEILDYENRLLN